MVNQNQFSCLKIGIFRQIVPLIFPSDDKGRARSAENFQYRNFLINNAEELMNLNRNYACEKNCCGPCKEPYHSINTLPELNRVKCNANNCELVGYDPNGLGQARQY